MAKLFKKIEKIYLPQLKKVNEINMEKMLDYLLHFHEYASITQKVKELSKKL